MECAYVCVCVGGGGGGKLFCEMHLFGEKMEFDGKINIFAQIYAVA